MNIEQHGARSVGRVGDMRAAAGQSPDQKAIDGAERKLAALRPCARIGHGVEDRRNLGTREIRIDQEAGLSADERFVSRRLQTIAGVGGAAILPDDRAMDGAPARALPYQRGLALVGDADSSEIASRYAGPGKRKSTGLENGPPEIFGIVLDPTGTRKVLRKLLLSDADDVEPGIEHDRARGRRALVDRKNVGAQMRFLFPRLATLAWPHAGLAWQEARSGSWSRQCAAATRQIKLWSRRSKYIAGSGMPMRRSWLIVFWRRHRVMRGRSSSRRCWPCCAETSTVRPKRRPSASLSGLGTRKPQTLPERRLPRFSALRKPLLRKESRGEGWVGLGLALQDVKDYAAAAGAFEQVVALRPGDARALVNRAISLQQLGNLADAMTSYGLAYQTDPSTFAAISQALSAASTGLLLLDVESLRDRLSKS